MKKSTKQEKEFRKLVFGKTKGLNVLSKKRTKKGKWDSEEENEKPKKKKKNFWVDADIFFKQDY